MKLFNKSLCAIVILIFTISLIMPMCMADGNIKVTLNGVELVFDVPPQLINNRTMVPMRKIFESLGTKVEWDEDTQTIKATGDGSLIIMQIDNLVMTVNGTDVTLDVPPQIVMDRTLVPVRAVAEGLKAEVNWIEESNTVEIIKNDEPDIAPTPTITPSTTPTPAATTYEGYEKNSMIPDYGVAIGVEKVGSVEPDSMISSWSYEYEYNEKSLQKYINILKENGFEQTYSSSTYGYGGNNLYFKKGDDGLYILYGESVNRVCVGFWEEGTASPIKTTNTSKTYEENNKVPNYGMFKSIQPLRVDVKKNSDGGVISTKYTYPWEMKTAVPLEVNDFFKDNGWEIAGPISLYGGAISKITYMKNTSLVVIVINQADNQISIEF